MAINDALEVLIKIFHGDRTQLVEDASNLYPIISMRVASIARGHQEPMLLFTQAPQFGNVVVSVA